MRSAPTHRQPGLVGLGLALAVGVVLYAFWDLIEYDPYRVIRRGVEGADAWFFSPLSHSARLPLACAGLLVFQRRRAFAGVLGAPVQPLIAGGLLACSLALAAWSHYVAAPGVLAPSLATFALAGGHLWGGRDGLRMIALPSALLLFCAPLPPAIVNALVFPLQLLTAQLAADVTRVLGTPAVARGDLIFAGGSTFHVIEACSGLRSILILTLAALTAAGLSRRRPVESVLLVASAPLLAIATNIARVVTLVLTPDSGFAESHAVQGVAAFCVGALAILGLDRLLNAVFPSRDAPATAAVPTGERRLALRVGSLALVALLIAARDVLPSWNPGPANRRSLSDIASRRGDWTSTSLDLDRQFLGSVGYTERLYRRFEDDGARVDVFIAVDDRLRPQFSLRSAKTALLGAGSVVVERAVERLEPDQRRADLLTVRDPRGLDWLVLHWYDEEEGLAADALRSWLALDRGPFRRPGFSALVRLATPVAGSRDAALETLRRFVPIARRALAELDPAVPLSGASPPPEAHGRAG